MNEKPSIGDRYRGGDLDDIATVIRVTGLNTAILRFDSDVAFNKQHGLPPTKSDTEFDLTYFTKVDQ